MMKYKFFIFTLFFFVGCFLFQSANAQESVRVYVQSNAEKVAPGSEITTTILIDSAKPVNAFEMTLLYPQDLLRPVAVNDSGSVVDLWKDRNWENQDGKIILSGGIIKPFSGTAGDVIKLKFSALKEGTAVVSFSNANIYYADGVGTLNQAITSAGKIIIDASAKLLGAQDSDDKSAPSIGFLETTTNPKNKNYLAVFDVKDSGSGVGIISLRQAKWFWFGGWKKTTSPVEIEKGVWMYQISATDNSGNKIVKTEYIWQELFFKLSLGIILLLVIVIFYYIITKWLFILLRKIF